MIAERMMAAAGALCGAAGVALSAYAAHAGGQEISVAAPILLAHAPALLAIGLAGRGRLLTGAGIVLLIGVLLFCGDLVAREFAGARLFPMAAPAGGMLMIAGWLAIAFAALSGRRGEP